MTGLREVWTWPGFDEPGLVKRLAMAEPEFLDLWHDMFHQMAPRDFSDEAFATGTGYPWPRPEGSFLLEDDEARLLADLEDSEMARAIEEFAGPLSHRTPMLAIGSNASPEGLWRKFGHFEDPEDRTLLAVNGYLHDFDIGATAELALYGAMPATVFPSPGTRANAMAIWLTRTQLTQLAWAEIPYWLGRLDTRFEFEEAVSGQFGSGLDRSLVFVNRFGTFGPEGHSFALSAISAEERRVPALSQVELLGRAAELTFGTGVSAEDLVRRFFENPGDIGPLVTTVMRSNAIAFESDRWTRFPG